MNSRRYAPVALALFVVAIAAWFVFRSHVGTAVPRPPGPRLAGEPTPMVTPISTEVPILSASQDLPSPHDVGAVSSPPATAVSPLTPVATAAPLAAATTSPSPDASLPVTPASASVNIAKVHRMVIDYHTLMGENPVGTNAEIMQALTGSNAKQAVLGPPEGQTLNANGELIDEWGTPYFFHQLSKDRMEIRSAGPDKIMGTPDDIMAK